MRPSGLALIYRVLRPFQIRLTTMLCIWRWVRAEAGCMIEPIVPTFAHRVDGLTTIPEDQA